MWDEGWWERNVPEWEGGLCTEVAQEMQKSSLVVGRWSSSNRTETSERVYLVHEKWKEFPGDEFWGRVEREERV